MKQIHLNLLAILPIFLTCTFAHPSIKTPIQDSYETDDTDECNYFFGNITDRNTTDPNMISALDNLFIYSGHSLNDLGFYKLCRDIPTQKYSIMNIEVGSIGFCGPSYCSIAQMQGYINQTIQILTNMTRQDLSQYGSITVIDPDQTGIQKGFAFYFTAILLAVLVGAVIAGSGIGCLKRRRGTRRPQYSFDPSNSSVRDPLGLNESSASDSVFNGQTLRDGSVLQQTFTSMRSPMYMRILECFDIAPNFEALFKNEKVAGHDQNLNVTAGIRALAFGWVVYGHTFLSSLGAKNFFYLYIFEKSSWLLILVSAFYAVDTFFYLSGFLAGFLLVVKLRKMPLGLKNYVLILFHRWIRLWPAYFVAILFYWKISVYMGSGPLWYTMVTGAQECSNGSAFKNFFLLDNVLNAGLDGTYCFAWGWYLSCDFQMFMITPIICWIYVKNRNRCAIIMWALLTLSFLFSYTYSSDSGFTWYLNPHSKTTEAFSGDYYINPLVRMSPYIVGLWLGIVFREYKDGQRNFFTHLKESTKASIYCFMIGLILLFFIVFYPRVLQTGTQWSDGFAMTWNTLSRPGFVFSLFLITAPCLVGNLKPVGNFLQSFYFVLIARLSYTAYLIHYVFLECIFSGMETYYGFSVLYTTCLALGVVFVALAGALILHLLVEKPLTNIEMKILSNKKSIRPVLTKNGGESKMSLA